MKRGSVVYFTPRYDAPSIPKPTPQLHLSLDPDDAVRDHEYYLSLAELMKRRVTHNISHFYGALFHTLFRGTLCHPHKLSFEAVGNGEYRNFHPDFIQHRAGSTHYTELKAVSRRSTRPTLSVLQVENYLHHLFRHYLDEKEPEPAVRFAFFRYKYDIPGRTTPDRLHPGKMPYDFLMKTLAERTVDLTIVPFPLLFLMLKGAKLVTYDQSSNHKSTLNERDYWMPHARQMNLLNTGDPSLVKQQLLRDVHHAYRESLEELLCLDVLPDVTQRLSPKTIICRAHTEAKKGTQDYPVTPFQITEYAIDEQCWLRSLVRNRKRLCKIMGIRDLHAEQGEPPF